jgi:uncharacterized protein
MRLICDAMLGKLSKYLRILGLNTAHIRLLTELDKYRGEDGPSVFFTRRKTQMMPYKNTLYIKSDNVFDQLKEISGFIKPYVSMETLMSRCLSCNAMLVSVEKGEIEPFVPEYIFHRYAAFKTCPACRKVYWEGSHVEHMKECVKELIGTAGEEHGR